MRFGRSDFPREWHIFKRAIGTPSVFTPKGLHPTAQGRERSERTLGDTALCVFYAEGVTSPAGLVDATPSG
jgi:hypothetical protein